MGAEEIRMADSHLAQGTVLNSYFQRSEYQRMAIEILEIPAARASLEPR